MTFFSPSSGGSKRGALQPKLWPIRCPIGDPARWIIVLCAFADPRRQRNSDFPGILLNSSDAVRTCFADRDMIAALFEIVNVASGDAVNTRTLHTLGGEGRPTWCSTADAPATQTEKRIDADSACLSATITVVVQGSTDAEAPQPLPSLYRIRGTFCLSN